MLLLIIPFIIPLAYEVYRGYIVFVFSVIVCVCVCVCVCVNFLYPRHTKYIGGI